MSAGRSDTSVLSITGAANRCSLRWAAGSWSIHSGGAGSATTCRRHAFGDRPARRLVGRHFARRILPHARRRPAQTSAPPAAPASSADRSPAHTAAPPRPPASRCAPAALRPHVRLSFSPHAVLLVRRINQNNPAISDFDHRNLADPICSARPAGRITRRSSPPCVPPDKSRCTPEVSVIVGRNSGSASKPLAHHHRAPRLHAEPRRRSARRTATAPSCHLNRCPAPPARNLDRRITISRNIRYVPPRNCRCRRGNSRVSIRCARLTDRRTLAGSVPAAAVAFCGGTVSGSTAAQ